MLANLSAVLDVFLSCLPPYVLQQGLSQNIELIDFVRLASQSAPVGIHLSQTPSADATNECK